MIIYNVGTLAIEPLGGVQGDRILDKKFYPQNIKRRGFFCFSRRISGWITTFVATVKCTLLMLSVDQRGDPNHLPIWCIFNETLCLRVIFSLMKNIICVGGSSIFTLSFLFFFLSCDEIQMRLLWK